MTSKRKGRVTKKAVWAALNAPIRKPSPWDAFDKMKWPGGELTIIMAARSTGKSQLYQDYYNRVIVDNEGSAQKYY